MLNTLKHPSSKSFQSIDDHVSYTGDFETNVTQANKFIENGNWDAAYPHLKTAVETNHDYAQGFNHLGIFYTKTQRYAEAINNFKKALQVDFTLTEAHYNIASLYMERKEHPAALSHFKEVVLANPNDYEAYYLMGVCCCHVSENDAITFFYESLRLKPDHVPSAIELCKLLIKKGNYPKAKHILLSIHRNDPSIPEVHFLLGIIYKIQKSYPKAMKHFREILLKDGNNAEAHNLLGECCRELNMDEQAETFFAMAAKLDTSYLDAFFNLGDLYYRHKRYPDAVSTLQEYVKTKEATDSINSLWSEATATHPENEMVIPLYNLLGYCYKMTHNPTKARSIWEKSLAIKPRQQEIKDALTDLKQPSRSHKRVSLVID